MTLLTCPFCDVPVECRLLGGDYPRPRAVGIFHGRISMGWESSALTGKEPWYREYCREVHKRHPELKQTYPEQESLKRLMEVCGLGT